MNKQYIYSCICDLESDLKSLMSNNRFSQLIVSEIINNAIISLHEVNSSDISDEDTAKGCVSLSIQSFYTPNNLVKVEDAYWNWDKRLHYGFRGRIMATPDNLIRFRMAVDTTRKNVQEEKNAMLYAVKNHKFSHEVSKSNLFQRNKVKTSTLAITFLGICILLFGVLNSFQHRYQKIRGVLVMDTWKGTLMKPNNQGEYVPFTKGN